jgi:hypothetical protein
VPGGGDPSFVHSERLVLQRVFREKRDFVVQRLKEIGFEVVRVETHTTITFSLSASSKKTNPLFSGAGNALKSYPFFERWYLLGLIQLFCPVNRADGFIISVARVQSDGNDETVSSVHWTEKLN